jgi:hypothetical protein
MELFPAPPPAGLTSPGYPSADGPPAASALSPPAFPPAPPPVGDVNALLANLLRSGIIGGAPTNFGNSIPGLDSSAETKVPGIEARPAPAAPTALQQKLLDLAGDPRASTPAAAERAGTPGGAPVLPIVLQSHHPSLKERQPGVIALLYARSDLQCKTCGQRYSREEMASYTAHLDWHFRVKRREKDNARKAQSRFAHALGAQLYCLTGNGSSRSGTGSCPTRSRTRLRR